MVTLEVRAALHSRRTHAAGLALVTAVGLGQGGCGKDTATDDAGPEGGTQSDGATTGSGGGGVGGGATGGATTGSGGGAVGGAATGGEAIGGVSSGGGGFQTGGAVTGGVTTGGAGPSAGGATTGGAGTAGETAGGGTSPAAGAPPTGGVSAGGTLTGGATGGGASGAGGSALGALKPRLVALTDIGPDDVEPDDSESLIHLFVLADRFEIEAVIAGSGYNSGNYDPSWADRIGSTIDAYERDASNLLRRSNQVGFLTDEDAQELGYWPSPDYLRSRRALGSPGWGTSVLGPDNDSDGSRLLVELGDEEDARPIWVTVWGGANTFAQALWRVQNDRTEDQVRAWARNFRVYTITDQDKAWGSTDYASSSHQWIRSQAGPDLLFLWDECAWLDHNAWGVDHWDDLYATNIQSHGNLGAMYSKYRWGVEGDTPSFLHLMPNGLSDPDAPGQGSWGGFFAYGPTVDGQTSAWVNEEGPANATCHRYTSSTFFPAAFNDFAARMDWASEGTGNRNPVVMVNDRDGLDVITMTPSAGASVVLDAAGTSDPDGDQLTYDWWVYTEAGTYAQDVGIADSSSPRATVAVPVDAANQSFHVICEVTDDGTPSLTSYRRVVFEPTG